MIAWLGRTPWAVALLAVLATAWLAVSAAADDRLARWIHDLGAADFTARETAARELASAGSAAIDPLARCLAEASPEAKWRAAATLEQIGDRGDAATQERVAAVFDSLARGDHGSLSKLARDIRKRQQRSRQHRAAQQFVALGGRFDAAETKRAEPLPTAEVAPPGVILAAPALETSLPAPPPDALPAENAPPAPGLIAPAIGAAHSDEPNLPGTPPQSPPSAAPTAALTISANWRGGDRGLAVLAELPLVSTLALDRAPLTDAALEPISALPDLIELNINQTPLSAAALSSYRQRRPQTCVLARGEALLGASANVPGPCVLTSIEPDSAAGEAGLKIGDEIVAAAGRPIRDLSDLTIAIYGHKPGERVPLEFSRSGQKRTVEVSLKAQAMLVPGQ